MKKLVFALLLGAGLVTNVSAVNPETDLDATIDEVSTQVKNSSVKRILAWMKSHKKATAVIGLASIAGVAITADMIYHAYFFDKKAGNYPVVVDQLEDGTDVLSTWFDNTVTKNYVINPVVELGSKAHEVAGKAYKATAKFVTDHKKAVIASTIALVAGVLVTADLTRGEKASLIRKLFAKKAANTEAVEAEEVA